MRKFFFCFIIVCMFLSGCDGDGNYNKQAGTSASSSEMTEENSEEKQEADIGEAEIFP